MTLNEPAPETTDRITAVQQLAAHYRAGWWRADDADQWWATEPVRMVRSEPPGQALAVISVDDDGPDTDPDGEPNGLLIAAPGQDGAARTVLAATGAGPVAWETHDADAAAATALQEAGYEVESHWLALAIDLPAHDARTRPPAQSRAGSTSSPMNDHAVRIVPLTKERSEPLRLVVNEVLGPADWDSAPYSESEWRDHYLHDPRAWTLLALRGGEILGFCSAAPTESDQRRDAALTRGADVQILGVVESARGMGIGTQLVRRMVEVLQQAGIARCEVGIDDAEPAGIERLYHRAGFETVEHLVGWVKG